MKLRTFQRILIAVCAVLCWCHSAKAQRTIPATDCTERAVQSALNQVALDGTTVVVPAGSCTWTTTVTYNQVYSTTIMGQTTCSGTPATSCVDSTAITDGVIGDNPSLLINTATGKSFRLTGITFQNNTYSPKYGGTLRVGGPCPTSCTPEVRLDQLHFNNIAVTSVLVSGVVGVMDHSVITMNGSNWNGVKVGNPGHSGFGDETWAAHTGLGASNFFFMESNSFVQGTMDDCDHGGRMVIRYNNFINGASAQTHPTGGAGPDLRGCRAWEIYGNTATGNPNCSGPCFNFYFISSGTGVVWGNSVDHNYAHVLTLHSMRRNANTYGETATPGGWGYCGTSFSGTGSAWDQNSNANTGYACLDMIGRGQGDLLKGSAPNKVNSATGTIAWPHQALEPVYEWMTTNWSGMNGYYATALDGPINQNQDYYLWCNALSSAGCTSFNGTRGVGSGLLEARPSTCTTQVAYWATDTNTLYQCSATNTWTAYYTPYTFPHPLVSGTPAPPSSTPRKQAF